MEPVIEEQASWLWDNLFLIIINLIFGVVTCVLIWVCTRVSEKESPPKESHPKESHPKESPSKESPSKESPSIEKQPCKELPSQDDTKVTTEEVVEDCTIEEVPFVESAHEDFQNMLDHQDETTMEISTEEVVEDITVEELTDLKDANEDLDHHDEGATIEVPSEVKVEASCDSSTEDFVVIKSIVTGETTVETVENISETTVTYEIDVRTGDVSGAGTDANVFIIVYGEHGDTGKIKLETSNTHHHKFERNQLDSFTEEACNVGKISKIRIGHDDKGAFAGWYLSNVVVNVPSLNCKWTFTADRWLDTKEDDKKVEVDIYPTLVVETYKETVYQEVKLEDAIKKGGDAIVAHTDKDPETDGSKTTVAFTTDTKILPSSDGSHDQMIVEEITVTTCEEVHTATINVATEDTHAHTAAPDVAVEAIVDHDKCIIESQDPSVQLVDDIKEEDTEFDVHAYSNDALGKLAVCMEKTDEISGVKRFDLMADVEPEKVTEGEKVTYSIDVKTGDIYGAGTNANVYITIYGTKKNTGNIHLSKSTKHKNKFERNQFDSFSVEAIDVGKIGKVRIGHDNKGGFAGWYLDYIVVCIPSTNHKETFAANRWLDKKEADGKLEIDLYPQSSYEDSQHEEPPKIVPTEVDLGELENAVEDYISKIPTTDDNDSEEITNSKISKDDESRAKGKSIRVSAQHLKFEVEKYNEKRDSSWRLANVDDILDCFEDVKAALRGNDWYLCTLEDGYIGGAGFDYEIRGEVKKHDHKLMVKAVPTEDVTTTDKLISFEDEVTTVEEVGEVESAPTDYMDECNEEVEVPTADVTTTDKLISFEDEVTTVEVGEVESAPTDYVDEFNEEVEEVKVPTEDVTTTDKLISFEDEIATVEEVGEVESAPTDYMDECNEEVEVPTDDLTIISSLQDEVTVEEFVGVESAPTHMDEGNEDVEKVKGSLHDLDAMLRANADILVKNVIETVRNSSLKLEFKVVGYNEEVDDDWRLACIDNVNNSAENVKRALEGKTWHVCALLDGTIAGAGFNYELKTDINKECQHKLIVKGTKVDDTGALCDADKDVHVTIAQEGSLDDTGDLLGAPTGMPITDHIEISDVKKEKKEKASSSTSSSSEDIDDEEVMKLFKKFDEDGDGRISIEEFMGRMKKDKKKRKKEKKKLKRQHAADLVRNESASVPSKDKFVIKDKETCHDPFHKFHGQFECHVYDGTETKNDWHYVVITYNPLLVEFTWSNAGGVKWTLYPYSEDTLRVGEDCPYYNDGHIFAKFTEDGVYGPWNELYQRIGPVLGSVSSSLPVVEFQVVDFHSPIDDHWRLATINDVEINMENVKNVLTNKTWHICALLDGNIGGPGYNYGVRHEVKELQHKLIIKAGMTTYDVDVKTGDHSGAGTDANVFIIIFGHKLSTGKIDLKESKTHSEKFERNHVDSFTIDTVDVGKILKIRIGHDNRGGFAGWYLENVVISNPGIGGKLTFVADRWLDLKEDDGKLEVELYPVKEMDTNFGEEIIMQDTLDHMHVNLDALDMLSGGEHIECEIHDDIHEKVTAPEICKEEEDAAIKIQSLMRGAKARKEVEALKASSAPPPPECSEEIISQDILEHKDADFDALDMLSAEVEITIDSVADLQDEDESFLIKLDIADHDVNVSDEQQQTVKTVEVRIDDEPSPVHAVENITVDEVDDLESDKYVTSAEDLAGMVSYEVDVKTGDVSGAGTDGNVFIIIFGEKGDTGKIVLETPKNQRQKTFERHCEDTFIVEAADVGKITNLRIGLDNKGVFSGWYLEKVVIHIPVQNCKLTFQADRWIGEEGDGKHEVDIVPSKEDECDMMCVLTENVPDVIKEDNTEAVSDKKADEGPEESKVEFYVDTDSPLAAENVLHKQCDDIGITDVEDKKSYEVEVKDIKAEMIMYNIDVRTGDVKFAGTDANVFIILYGDNSYTTKIDLKKSKTHKSPFERNQLDSFEVETLNVGNLEKVRIGHDNHGGFAGWYIDEVVVHAPSIGCKWTFPANRWLDKHKDDGKLEVDLHPSTK